MHLIEELVWERNYSVAKRLFGASNAFSYSISLSPLKTSDLNPTLITNEVKGFAFFKLPIVKLFPLKNGETIVVLNEKLQTEYHNTWI